MFGNIWLIDFGRTFPGSSRFEEWEMRLNVVHKWMAIEGDAAAGACDGAGTVCGFDGRNYYVIYG